MMNRLGLGSRLRIAAKAMVGSISPDQASTILGQLTPRISRPSRSSEELPRFSERSPLLAMGMEIIGAKGVATAKWRLVYPTNRSAAKLARELPALTWDVRLDTIAELRRAGDLREVAEHPLLTMMERNVAELPGNELQRLSALFMEMTGEVHWLLLRNGASAPSGALLLPTAWVRELPRAGRPAYEVAHSGWQGTIPASEILSFIRRNPANPYGRGIGILAPLIAELETDEFASDFVRGYFLNDARPPAVISAEGLTDPEITRLERWWLGKFQGFRKAWAPAFTNVRDIKVHEFSRAFGSETTELRERNRKFVLQYLGIPPELAGDVNESKRSTIEHADFIFAKYVQVPRLEAIRSRLQPWVEETYDERLVVTYDNPIREDREFLLSVRQAFPWAFQIDEHRAFGGAEQLGPERGGSNFPVPPGVEAREDWRSEPPPDSDGEPPPPPA